MQTGSFWIVSQGVRAELVTYRYRFLLHSHTIIAILEMRNTSLEINDIQCFLSETLPCIDRNNLLENQALFNIAHVQKRQEIEIFCSAIWQVKTSTILTT